MQSVGGFLPLSGARKTDRHTGTHTAGLGSRVAEVAGDDRHGGVSWMVCIQIHGRVFTAGKEDRVRLINSQLESLIDAILRQETRRKVADFVPWNSLIIKIPLHSSNRQCSIAKFSVIRLTCEIASRSVLMADSTNRKSRLLHFTTRLRLMLYSSGWINSAVTRTLI